MVPHIFNNPEEEINLDDFEASRTFVVDDLLIYCSSSNLFSSSMYQAFCDKKDSCVMILNPDAFFKVISSKLESQGFNQKASEACIYTGKGFVEYPRRGTLSNHILENKALIGYFKPKSFANQEEFRTTWINENKADNDYSPVYLNISELKDLLLEIDISGIDPNKLFVENRSKGIEVRITMTNGDESQLFLHVPYGIPSPIIVHHKDSARRLLGFKSREFQGVLEGNVFSDYVLASFHSKQHGMILHLNYLDEIAKISFATVV